MSAGRFARGSSPGFRVGTRLPVVRSGEPPEGHHVKVDLGGGTDPLGNWGGRFQDVGAYVSHDEPSVKVISSAPGRGSTMTDVMRLAKDPKGKPTVSEWQDGQRLRRTQSGSVVRPYDARAGRTAPGHHRRIRVHTRPPVPCRPC